MPAALVLGPKRQSGRWSETFHRVIMEHFCPRTIFLLQFGIPTSDTRRAALLARVDEVI
jgi:hypothetical protein